MSYRGAGGTMYQCDEANADWTCQATMGKPDKRSDFPVFYTDYTNYQISYFCMDMIDCVAKYEWFSVYTRDQFPSEETMALAKAKVAELIPQYDVDSLLNMFLYWTNQKNCEYEW